MKWFSENYKWLFDGVAGAVLLAVIGYVIRRFRGSRLRQGNAVLTAQGANVVNSPVASGSGITQTINSPITVNVSSPAPLAEKQVIAVGTYLQERIVQMQREVAHSRNNAGLIGIWPEVVREILAKYPNLSPAEKASLRGNVEGQIQLLSIRTGMGIHSFTGALQEVARLLGA